MKTQITDWLFIYNTIENVITKKLKIKLKIFYYTLEMSREEKMRSMFSNLLFIKEGIRISPSDLRSTRKDKVLSEEILNILNKYEDYFKEVESIITFIDDTRHPTGIFYQMKEYALGNGVQHTEKKIWNGKEVEIDSYYEPNNINEYVIVIVDHLSLITPESENGRMLSLHQSITKLSSNYFVQLRNKYNYIIVGVQQQAASQESLDNKRANRLKPTLDGLADCKLTTRDADVILGLFSPFRHEFKEYLEYDITFFKDNIRFLEILGGREGGAGTICPLYFDGAVNYFKELPLPDNTEELKNTYRYINNIRHGINK